MVITTNAMIPEHGHIQPFFRFLYKILVLALHHRLVPVVLDIYFVFLFVQRVSLTSLLESVHHPMMTLLLGLSIRPLKKKRLSFISHFCLRSPLGHTGSSDLFWKHTIKLLTHRDWVDGGLSFLVKILCLVHFHDLVGFITTHAIYLNFGRIGNSGTTIWLFCGIIRIDNNITIYSFYWLVHKVGVYCGCTTPLSIILMQWRPIRKRWRTRIIKRKAYTVVIPFTVKLLLKFNSAIGCDSVFENWLQVRLLRLKNGYPLWQADHIL